MNLASPRPLSEVMFIYIFIPVSLRVTNFSVYSFSDSCMAYGNLGSTEQAVMLWFLTHYLQSTFIFAASPYVFLLLLLPFCAAGPFSSAPVISTVPFSRKAL